MTDLVHDAHAGAERLTLLHAVRCQHHSQAIRAATAVRRSTGGLYDEAPHCSPRPRILSEPINAATQLTALLIFTKHALPLKAP